MKKFLLIFLVCLASIGFSQIADVKISNNYKIAFDEAYLQNPEIPRGILEAVAYTNSRLWHISADELESCTGLPKAYGVMGLILDGKNWFRENLRTVSQLSGYSIDEIIENPAVNIKAYAAAYSSIKTSLGINSSKIENHVAILRELSEIPVHANDAGNDYALNCQLYEILSFLNKAEFSSEYHFPLYQINLIQVFGENNLKILASPKIQVSANGIINEDGIIYQPKNVEVTCPDYPFSNCSWVASPNYSSRSGAIISSVTIHTVQGSYAGCISWFQNTSSSASTQYVVRSSDGQLTQMVTETNKAWHVGSENPYTIGYEHEGWVDNPAWYTAAMYSSSATLTRDVCSQWNINLLRTFFRDTLDNGTALDYGVHSQGAEGSCLKIKGHQHYPNQTHTDPGPNWNWNHYFKLLNSSPAPTSYTASSGSFYDTGGASADYGDDERNLWLIAPTNASDVTINFTSFAMEADYDFMYIYDGDNVFAPLLGRWNTTSPGTITAASGKMLIEFRSDCSTVGTGWAATWSSQGVDNVAPATNVSSSGNWKIANFTASFSDTDNSGGSGIEKGFYQVLDNNGTDWRANNSNGFFADNFDIALNPDWTNAVGTWQTANGNLEQGDTSQSNTNIYATLNQTLSNRYLYHFYAKIGAGVSGSSQRRFGFHFFSDNGSLTNRGNGYFIFFRQETSKLEFYKVTSDVFTQVKVVDNITTNINQWYDIKVIYDRVSGKMDVYRDNIFLGTWTDTTPYATGNYISFRSGNSHLYINELKVYRSRTTSENISLGSGSANDIRFQNPNPTTYGAKIKSICNDFAGNISAISYHDLNIDWTVPSNISAVFEGLSNDVDTIFVNNEISANWAASLDPNSGITSYWYCIGSTLNGTDVLNWTDNGINVNFIASGLSLSYNQTYYVSVKAENGAGLQSSVTVSDGVFVKIATSQPVAGFTYSSPYICTGTSVEFINTSTNATSYQWTITGPQNFNSVSANPSIAFSLSGAYSVNLVSDGPGGTDAVTQTVDVTIYPAPVANAGVDQSICSGESVILSGSGGIQFQWNNGVNNGVAFTPLTTNSYIVTVTDGNNCSDKDTVSVVVKPVPVAVTDADQTVCTGTLVTLNASGGDNYFWDNNVINNVPFYPSGTATYTVTVTNSYNCSDIASLTVTVNSLPVAAFGAIDTLLIFPDSSAVFINTSANATNYLWDFGDGYTSYDENPWHTYTTDGYYTVILYATSNTCGTDTLVYANYIHVINPLSISTIFVDNLMVVSPNPFNDEFAIYLSDKSVSEVSLSIIDMLGKTIFLSKEKCVNGFIHINDLKNNFADGVYTLQIYFKEYSKAVRIVKETVR